MKRMEIVQARTDMDMTMDELAEKAQVSSNSIFRFENGRQLRREAVIRLCAVLQLPVKEEYVLPRRLGVRRMRKKDAGGV